jgi:hypothetical protein
MAKGRANHKNFDGGQMSFIGIEALACGGFAARRPGSDCFTQTLAAFSTKPELLTWLDANLAEPAKTSP